MNAAAAEALATRHGAGLWLVPHQPESGPWLTHPARVAALMSELVVACAGRPLAGAAQQDEALALAWVCDLLADTEIGVAATNAALGRNLGALTRMASREVRGVEKTRKSAEVYWRVVGRGPVSVRAAAACTLLARMETARRWPDRLDLGALCAEGVTLAPPHLVDLPALARALRAAVAACQ